MNLMILSIAECNLSNALELHLPELEPKFKLLNPQLNNLLQLLNSRKFYLLNIQ